MPISQDRMIELIHSAKAFQQSHERLQLRQSSLARQIEEGTISHQQAWDLLAIALELLIPPGPFWARIAKEEAHFKAVSRANNRRKDYLKGKRLENKLGSGRAQPSDENQSQNWAWPPLPGESIEKGPPNPSSIPNPESWLKSQERIKEKDEDWAGPQDGEEVDL